MSNEHSSNHNKTLIVVAIITAISTIIAAYIGTRPPTPAIPSHSSEMIGELEKITKEPESDGENPPKDIDDCTVTIDNSLVSLKKEPNTFSQDLVSVPRGEYKVFEYKTIKSAIQTEGWIKISVKTRIGWIEDNTWTIKSKSDGCP